MNAQYYFRNKEIVAVNFGPERDDGRNKNLLQSIYWKLDWVDANRPGKPALSVSRYIIRFRDGKSRGPLRILSTDITTVAELVSSNRIAFRT